MAKNIFKGIKCVTQQTFSSLTTDEKQGYMWFVRTPMDDENDSCDIYMGSRCYGHYKNEEINSILETLDLKLNKNELMIELTWSDLVNLKGNYIPGQQYRIIDYITTTSQDGTQSAGHQFDIIVTADDENTLNDVARAINHDFEGGYNVGSSDDSAEYFVGQSLKSWKIWYDINNAVNKYEWGGHINGKGVIYRMIDERGNDCAYDFKNIQFNHPIDSGDTSWYFTFSDIDSTTNIITDKSLTVYCYSNTVGVLIDTTLNVAKLNYNVWMNEPLSLCFYNELDHGCYRNKFSNNCVRNKFAYNCRNNDIGAFCSNNYFYNDCYENILYDKCEQNTFNIGCFRNVLYGENLYNFFGIHNSTNKLGYKSSHNTFSSNCWGNELGDYCYANTFGPSCRANSIRLDDISTSELRDYCYYNNFDAGCSWVILYNGSTATDNFRFRNHHVNSGVIGSSDGTFIYVPCPQTNSDYKITITNNSNGDIKKIIIGNLV